MNGGKENTLSQMRELITQCYNHPSVYCWGLSNEITSAGVVTEELLENHRALNELCHQLDPPRPTTIASVFTLETDSKLLEVPDILAYNLYFGWYTGALEQNDAFFDTFHARFPHRAIGFSEFGADSNIRFQTAAPQAGDYTEQYQTVYHEHILPMLEERPWIYGAYVWNMFEFAADGRDEGGEHGINQKGLVTFDHKTQKVAEPNPGYQLDKQAVKNWFDEQGTNPEYFSVNDTYAEIMAHPEAGALLGKLMAKGAASRGDAAVPAAQDPNLQRMLGRMTIAHIMKRGGMPESIVNINQALQKIKKG